MDRVWRSSWTTLLATCWFAGAMAIFGCSRDTRPTMPMSSNLRIVSLAPSVTEILFELGLGDHLVGATDHCDYPPAAVGIERVGGFGAPNVEKLLALSPDLVIAAGFERGEIADLLRNSGVRVLDVTAHNFEELFDAVRQIGEATDRSQQAEGVVSRMRMELDTIAAANDAAPRRKRPKVFVEVGNHPLITAGGTSFLDDLIDRAGGVNAAHEVPRRT